MNHHTLAPMKIAENVQSDSKTTELTIPDPDEIRPRRPILRAEITEVENWHQELHDLRRQAINRAFDIGFKLRCWHELIPHGKWLPWLKANVAIPERTAYQYLLLWDHNEEIKAAFKFADSANLSELPPIKDALALIANKRAEKHPIPVTTAKQVVHRIPAARTSVESAGSQANHLDQTETHPSDETDSDDQTKLESKQQKAAWQAATATDPNPTKKAVPKAANRISSRPPPPPKEGRELLEFCEVGWILLTAERDMAVLALTPKNEEWKKSALEFFESLRNRKITSAL